MTDQIKPATDEEIFAKYGTPIDDAEPGSLAWIHNIGITARFKADNPHIGLSDYPPQTVVAIIETFERELASEVGARKAIEVELRASDETRLATVHNLCEANARIEQDRATIAKQVEENAFLRAQVSDLDARCNELKETVNRLNRRATRSEGVLMAKVKDHPPGHSLGRALANSACFALREANERLEDENASLRERLQIAESKTRVGGGA